MPCSCIKNRKYYLHFSSADCDNSMMQQPNDTLHKRYNFKLTDILRDETDAEYFSVNVEHFLMYLPHGLQKHALAIQSPQIQCPFFTSNTQLKRPHIGSLFKPLCFAHPQEVVDIDPSNDTDRKAVVYSCNSTAQSSQVCTIQRDAFIDIIISDEQGKVFDYGLFPFQMFEQKPNYTLLLSIEPLK